MVEANPGNSMIKITRISILLAVSCAVSACGSGRQGIYIDSSEIEPLQVPANLDRPSTSTAMFVPGVSAPELAGLRDAAKPPMVLTSEQAEASDISIGYGDGALFMLVKDTPASVHHRLRFSLNRGVMRLKQTQTDQLAHEFNFQQPPETKPKKGFFGGLWDVMTFWSSSEELDYSGDYRVVVKPDDNNPAHARVYLYNDQGQAAGSDRAEMIFDILQERLG